MADQGENKTPPAPPPFDLLALQPLDQLVVAAGQRLRPHQEITQCGVGDTGNRGADRLHPPRDQHRTERRKLRRRLPRGRGGASGRKVLRQRLRICHLVFGAGRVLAEDARLHRFHRVIRPGVSRGAVQRGEIGKVVIGDFEPGHTGSAHGLAHAVVMSPKARFVVSELTRVELDFRQSAVLRLPHHPLLGLLRNLQRKKAVDGIARQDDAGADRVACGVIKHPPVMAHEDAKAGDLAGMGGDDLFEEPDRVAVAVFDRRAKSRFLARTADERRIVKFAQRDQLLMPVQRPFEQVGAGPHDPEDREVARRGHSSSSFAIRAASTSTPAFCRPRR